MGITTLSSRLTFVTKFIFPTIWIVGFGYGTLAMWVGEFTDKHGGPPPIEAKFGFLAIFAAGSVFILWTCARLKKIRVDDRSIYVSNFFKEISLPVDMIVDVTGNRWLSSRPVTIRFRGGTEFGDRITFIPAQRPFLPWRHQPVVEELRRLAGLPETSDSR
jgi:hypothetical protein